MGKKKRKSKHKVVDFTSDIGDISVIHDFGAKYRIEVTEKENSTICGGGGVHYCKTEDDLVKFLKKANATYKNHRTIEIKLDESYFA